MDLSGRFLALTTHGAQWVLWLLIGLSVISVAVVLERIWCFATYRPEPRGIADTMRSLLATASVTPWDSDEKRSHEAIDAALEGAKARERLFLESNLTFLGTLGSNAPFIGLFGTVLGIIKAFHDLAGNQSGGPAVVMAGISEALVATAVGLLVAIPAVIAFNFFNRRVRTSMTQVDWMAQLALAQIKAEGAQGNHTAMDPPKLRPDGDAAPANWMRRPLVWAAVGTAVIVIAVIGEISGPSRTKGGPAQHESAPAPPRVPQLDAKPQVLPKEAPGSATPQDLATPDLATPDLATPDLATRGTPDLATPAEPRAAAPRVEMPAVHPKAPKAPKGKKRRAPAAIPGSGEPPDAGATDSRQSSSDAVKDSAAAGGL